VRELFSNRIPQFLILRLYGRLILHSFLERAITRNKLGTAF
jgi:hypothetical protein